MAHAARLDKLAQSLVTATTGRTPDDRSFRNLKDATLKGLRDQSHARTNQFAVNARLEGLIEKLVVLSRDDLAEALQTRLDELPTRSRYLPEILSLLLELSDRPAEKTLLSHVGVSNNAASTDPQLTWQEIIADDPLNEADIWDDVEGGYHSSGDELGSGPDEDHTQSTAFTAATSVDGDEPGALARLHLVQPQESCLANIKKARDNWRTQAPANDSKELSELELVREILTIFQGYPTDLFAVDPSSGRVTLSRKARLVATSTGTTMDILHGCAKSASNLNFLRKWTRSSQPAMHIRTMQASTRKLLSSLASELADIELQFARTESTTVVSAINVATMAESAARGLVNLASVVQVLSLSDGRTSQLNLLDSLYDLACAAQLSDDATLFQVLATVFLDGLATYLRPTATWIMTGTLSASAYGIPLVKDDNIECEPGDLWHSRYAMNVTRDGSPFAPKCMHAFSTRIFALGKGRAFLRRLDQNVDDDCERSGLSISLPRFDDLVSQLHTGSLLSFSQQLDYSLQKWVEEISTDCMPLLTSKLWNEHGLEHMLQALPYVYFSKDGAAFQSFADTLVERVAGNVHQGTWSDVFMLSEVAQTAFSDSASVDSDSMQIRLSEASCASTSGSIIRKLAVFDLEYNFAWPLQNVTRCRTSTSHAQVLAFLLQIFFASTLLGRSFLEIRSVSRSSNIIPLRQRLMNFTGILYSYVTTTAHCLHERTMKRFQSTRDIDAMVEVWSDYTQSLDASLLLSSKLEPVRDAITGMLELSELLAKTTRPESILVLQGQFEKSLSFLIAGIRGVSRAGGESALETLAERLELSVG